MEEFIESSNHRPGEPLRSWTSGEMFAALDAPLHLKAARAGPAIARLLRGEDPPVDDVIAFGRLNWFNVFSWYEPMVVLFDHPKIAPDIAGFLRGLDEKVWR